MDGLTPQTGISDKATSDDIYTDTLEYDFRFLGISKAEIVVADINKSLTQGNIVELRFDLVEMMTTSAANMICRAIQDRPVQITTASKQVYDAIEYASKKYTVSLDGCAKI